MALGERHVVRPGQTSFGVVQTSAASGANSFGGSYEQGTYFSTGADLYVGGIKVNTNDFEFETYTSPCRSHELQEAVLSEDGEVIEGSCVSCGGHISVHRIPGGMPVLELEQLLMRMDDEPVGSDELVEAFVDAADKLNEERRKLESAELVLELARRELARRLAL